MTNEYSPLTLISRYRDSIMGLAIMGVMVGHWFGLGQIPSEDLFSRTIRTIAALIFTQGFLFLSGFGIYFSLLRNNDTLAFYRRRFFRIVVPFMLMATPFFLIRLCFENSSFWQFLGYITTLSYWVEGNYCGMWYVAVSIILYLFSPLLYAIFFRRSSFVYTTVCLVVILVSAIICNHLIATFALDYYKMHDMGLEQYFIFFIGMYCGYLSRLPDKERHLGLGLIVALLPIAFLLAMLRPEYSYLTAAMRRVVITIPLVSLFFALMDKVRFGKPIMQVFNWLGAYTFELYILHLLIYCFLTSEVPALPWSHSVCITLAIILALVLCAPVQKGIQYIIRKR